MPRHPLASPSAVSMTGSVYSSLVGRLARFEGETYPFHVGDTWMEPAEGCRMQDLTVEEHPGMHRYAPPRGLPALLEGLAERVAGRTGVATARENVLVTASATAGLAAAVGALVAPGEEVLILAPYWPLIAGIVRSFHGEPVAVPFLGTVDSPESAVEAVAERLTGRTAALYLSTPNNPTGELIPRPWLEALVEWARAQDLWILADEVYEDYVYSGEHTYARALAPERTVAAYSFSKAYGMAGNRCGYLAGPAEILSNALKVSTHTVYSTPTAAQLAALRVLEGRADAWLADAQEKYAALGRMAAKKLGVEPPAGSAFLFLDVAPYLDRPPEEGGLLRLLERCADRGLLAAPGPSFGPYPACMRVCFTAAPPPVVERGFSLLAEILESCRQGTPA